MPVTAATKSQLSNRSADRSKSNGTNLDTSTWANAFPPSLFSHYSRLIDHGYWGLFFQDQWRITPKLTLNYGLRWDVESGLGGFVNQDYNGWQPRVGIAYSPDSKTVLRAGFGIFDDRYNRTFFFVPEYPEGCARLSLTTMRRLQRAPSTSPPCVPQQASNPNSSPTRWPRRPTKATNCMVRLRRQRLWLRASSQQAAMMRSTRLPWPALVSLPVPAALVTAGWITT